MVKKEEIKKFPDSPGIYIMRDASGKPVYIGKALSLRKRVASYFLKSVVSAKTHAMMSCVAKIDYRVTPSEYDAVILEDRLIKEYQPRFNVISKDDKSFPYIMVTSEDFPRVYIGRRKKLKEGTDYFGPYTSAKLLRRALDILRKSFPYCSCRRFPRKVCLLHHLGLCAGPCKGDISRKKYLGIISGLKDFLLKRDNVLVKELSQDMGRLVKQEKFEDAARVRDKLEALGILISLKKNGEHNGLDVSSDFRRLGIAVYPVRIEAFDISNIFGEYAVGSVVSFYKDRPDKKNYRRFKIKSVAGIDDYAMMRELVSRRIRRLLAEAKPLPDLVVIDGGRGHIDAVHGVLKELKADVPIIAIAKSQDLIYTIYNKLPVKLAASSNALRLIQYLRDEAHRFAVKYHRLLRKKGVFEKG